MEHLKTVKHPGKNGKDFEVRVMDMGNELEVSTDLWVEDRGQRHPVNVRRTIHPKESNVDALISQAQQDIDFALTVNEVMNNIYIDVDILGNHKK